MVKLSLHKRRAGLIVLLGVLSAAVLAPNVLSLQASATAASTGSTKQGLKQGTAPELLASPRARAALERLQSETGGRVVSHLSNKTGNLDFVRATGDALLAADKGSGTPEARAQAFLSEHGALVGLSDAELRRVATGDSAASGPSSELRVVSVDRDNIGSAHVRFNQFYQGLPVFGAQLIVHMSARGITAINGDFVPDIKLAAAPRISPKEAGQIALRYQLVGAPLSVVKAELSIYRLGLLEGYRGPSVLAYGVEVTDRKATRDQIWINANSGKLINRIPLNHKALNRTIYSPDYDPDNPDMFVVKREGDPLLPGPPPGTTGANPIDNLYVFAGQIYNLFASGFGRDSYDGLGHDMASVYLINDQCPNAYWNGIATNYCPDFDADDVVAHEWTHGYTQFTHNLIYAYQSGALNEAYSDIFGETVDLLNGVDAEGGSNNAQPLPNGQRWQVGDDVPTLNAEAAGILRDMWDPTRYQDPDKVSSPNYACGSGDGGGVHTNSGVPNHAFAILVDGKTFNGQTVQGIGFTKALHIYYRAMTVYQTPTTDFPAHDQALQASCADLAQAGTNLNALSTNSANSVPSGQIMTANDCLQVAKAMLAVEMSTPSPCPVVILLDPDAPEICLGAADIFTENWETGMDGWTLTSTGVFADWEDSSRSIRDFTINSTLPAGRSGSAAHARNAPLGQPGGGDCQPGSQDYSGQFTIDSPTITIPPGASTLRLSFDHYVATEATFDGGQVEISVNGAAFSLVAQESYLHNPPNSQFDAPPPVGLNTNPNAGEFAWHGTNIGTPSGSPPGSWGTTLVDLSSLAAPGNTIKIRFTFSQDGCNGVDGWYVDNVRLFSCPTLEAPTLSIGADYENPDTNGSYTFNWIRPAGASGPDVLQESATSCAPLISDNAESGLGQWTVFSSAVPPTLTTWDNAPANAKPQHNSATFWGHGAEQETQNTFTTLTYNNPIPIPNTGTTTLSFSDWYFNEDDDNGFAEVSTNNGATWTQVYSAFRNMGDLPDAGATAFANEVLTDRNVDLSIYSGQSIRLRFKYLCGQSNFFLFIQYGWHIDNISIANESWQNVVTINATTFTVSGRGPGTRCYRVRTTYTLGSQSVPSPYSNVVSATVLTGACLYTLDPTNEAFLASGGSDTVSVIAAAGCNWTATSNDGFITINSGSNGTGNGTVNYALTSNSDDSSRSGSMTIAGQTFVVTQAGSTPTAVKLEKFNATAYDNGVFLEWQTGFEVDNLGFNIYRMESGQRTLITPDILAGSALATGSAALTAGRTYRWWDSPSNGGQQSLYYLEDIDINGTRSLHGPVTPAATGGRPPKQSPAALLSGFGDSQSLVGLSQTVDREAMPSLSGQNSLQSALASEPAVKLSVKREGWYRLTQPELVAAGFDPNVNPRFLQLFVDGHQQPVKVIGEEDSRFDPSDAVEFYGVGVNTAVTDTRVYWLVAGSQLGQRTETVKSSGKQPGSGSFLYTVERKDRTIYFSALPNGEKENFFGAVIAGDLDQTLTLSHIAQSDSVNATLEVTLQGVTLGPHRVDIELNGNQAGVLDFDGRSQGVAKFNVPHSLLREGQNVVRLTPLAGPSDVSLVDYIRISYQRYYVADNDSLKLTAAGGQQITIDGFTSDSIRVIDVTDPDRPQEVIGSVDKRKAGYAITFAPPAAGERSLLAFATERRPASVSMNLPSNLRSLAADFIIITNRQLADSLKPLVELRQFQGLTVTLIGIEDIYDEFSFGQKTPFAVKDFLSFAKSNWKKKPRFVLFAGDASFDPKNYLGLGDSDFVPTKLIDTDFLETSSDDWLADFDSNGVADLAIGRLPARSTEELSTMVAKIIGYEQSSPSDEALLAADANDGFAFEQASTDLRSLIPSSLRITQVNRGRLDPEMARRSLFDALYRRQLLVNYVGHGSANEWRGNFLTNDDALGLRNDHLPMFVMMTCLNGYFHNPALDSLAESLLKAERGGAVAAWASSGMTLPADQALLNQAFYRLLFNRGRVVTLGEAVMQAKSSINDSNVRRTWILLGDPTTKLR